VRPPNHRVRRLNPNANPATSPDHPQKPSFLSTLLEIPSPNVNLEAGSGTQAVQTADIIVRYEQLLLERPASVCLVVSEVTSTMACAIAARKLRIPVTHVEGGIRSGDWTMPEEINRLLTDAITKWFFTISDVANANLWRAGVEEGRIFFVGNTMINTLLANLYRTRRRHGGTPRGWCRRGTTYLLCTARPTWTTRPVSCKILVVSAATAGAPALPRPAG
jgi:UDP-N-acetylglucosamine 2-epimerase